MFREKYIRDNELVKPDDDFLNHLKESVMQEDEKIHINDYVDYANSDNFEKIGKGDDKVVTMSSREKRKLTWGKLAAVAACFVFACTVAYTVGRSDAPGTEGIQTNMESVLPETTVAPDDSTGNVNQEDAAVADELYELFSMNNVRIYEIDSYQQDMGGIEYIQDQLQDYRQLDIKERDELVNNILNNRYILSDTAENLNNPIYYIAEFENRSSVVFAIDSDYNIYIVEISGIQNMACR